MKHSFGLFLTVFLFMAVTGCTSEKGKLEDLGRARAEKDFEEVLQKEARDLASSEFLREAYYRYYKSNAEIQVEEVHFQGEAFATVSTSVLSYPTSLRRTVLEVAARMDPTKAGQFNFGNATSLVAKEKGLSLDKVPQLRQIHKFSKSGGSWTPSRGH